MATSTIIRRMHEAAPPIGRHVESMVLDYDVNSTTVESDIELNGTILHAYIVAPALSVGTDYTFSIEDEDDDEMYNSGTLTHNSTTKKDPNLAVCGTITLKIVTASAQTSDATFKVKLIYS